MGQKRSKQRLKHPRRRATRVFLSPLAKRMYLEQKAMTKKEQKFWGCVTWTVFLAMIVTTILVIKILFSGVYFFVAVGSYVAFFPSFLGGLYLCFDQKKIPSRNRSLTKLCVVVLVIVVFGALGFGGFFFVISESEISILLVLAILAYLAFVALASGGVLFCWKVKGAKDARERAMGMAAVASVVGILLTVAVTFMSTNQTLSDCACESCSSNDAPTKTYQDECCIQPAKPIGDKKAKSPMYTCFFVIMP